MNEHIKHLEEPLYVGDINSTNMNFLDVVHSDKLTIKIDGSPSIFFGNVDDKFFVATKSIFNKKRKIYFSVDDIYDTVTDVELAEKLKVCFNLLKNEFKQSVIYQADLISWCKNDNTIYQPNVLQYYVPSNEILNMSIHTTYYDLNFIEKHYNDDIISLYNHNNSLIIPESKYTSLLDLYNTWQLYVYDYKTRFNDEDIKNIKHMNVFDVTLERYFNNCVRTNITPTVNTYGNWVEEKIENFLSKKLKIDNDVIVSFNNIRSMYKTEMFSEYLNMYNYTVHIKNQIIEVLNSVVNDSNGINGNHVANFKVLNVNKKHEGFVFSTPFKKIKMVNRSEFSYHNFLNHRCIK